MMKTIARAAVVAVVAGGLNVAVLAPAQAQVAGRRCSVTVKGGVVQLTGGPLVAGAVGAPISLKCTLQLGTANSTHAGADAAVADSGPSVQVAVVPPTPVSIDVADRPAYVCTEATVDGVTYYLDATFGVGWTTSPAGACDRAIDNRTSIETIDGALGDLNEAFLLLDPLLCSVLVQLTPGVPGLVDVNDEGDVYLFGVLFWDCPPYEEG